MNRISLTIVSMIAALTLAACGGGSNTLPSSGDSELAGGETGGGSRASTSGDAFSTRIGEEALGAEQQLLDELVVYFEFDRSEIRSEFNSMLAAHGRYLASNPNVQVRLEGHADERGSREYNIGLGERRAQAVRTILLLQGAQNSQLSTVSYGEERPAVFGSDEESYSLNRRVEIVYR